MGPQQHKIVFNNVQALRGLAAFMVVLFHYSILIDNPAFRSYFVNFEIGVQLFFIISGFIMVHTTRNIRSDYPNEAGRFLLRRIIRIVPLYYIITFFVISDDLNNGYLAENSGLLIKSLLFISPLTVETGPKYGFPCLPVGWTLNYEMFFYLLFAITLFFGKFRYWILYAAFAVLVFVIPFFSATGFSIYYTVWRDYDFRYLNVLTNPMLLHFLFGITAALVLHLLKPSKITLIILVTVSLFCFLFYSLGFTGIPFNIITDLLICGSLAAGFILCDYAGSGITMPAWLIAIGNYSYSLYLIHPVAIVYLKLFFVKAGYGSVLNTFGFYFVAIAFALLVAWVSYQLIEVRLSGWLRNKLKV